MCRDECRAKGGSARLALGVLLYVIASVAVKSATVRADDAQPAGEATTPPPASPAFPAEDIEFFERKIRPVLVERCYKCHSADAEKLQAGLRLDSRDGLIRGGDSGPSVEPGEIESSLLIEAVRHAGLKMPPDALLPKQTIADFERWVKLGAPWPAEKVDPAQIDPASGRREPAGSSPAQRTTIDIEAGKRFWSFQPVVELPAPAVSNPAWPRTKLDYFVLQKLDEKKLLPSPQADPRALVRRLYIDLIGLAPTYEEVEAFAANPTDEAYNELVDRLLASPLYGERWARRWLDVARYGEDHPDRDGLTPRQPHKYRDWVIRALNDDVPYDEFIRRQLAADMQPGLPKSELAALGFLGLSPVYYKEQKRTKEFTATTLADEWEERIDLISRGIFGLTVACARCHDHKFDPITAADYYALAGVVASIQLVERPTVEMFEEDAINIAHLTEELREHQERYKARYNQREGLKKSKEPDIYRYDKEILESASEIQRITSLLPPDYESIPRVDAVMDAAQWVDDEFHVVRELSSPEVKFWTHVRYTPGRAQDVAIQIRGSVASLGPVVPRRFLEVLSPGEPQPFRQGSGRLELANAMLTDAQALTGRVIVNRLWGWHFGQPLVKTPSNFGKLGLPPSHPELLDDLTARFIAGGWSLKQLHREIVRSAAWRQASAFDGGNYASDAENTWLWRMNRQRLDLESWRDSMLKVAGHLDSRVGGRSGNLDDVKMRRRSVYGKASRLVPAGVMQLFDFPSPIRHSDERSISTTPLQQLFYMNSPFVDEQASAIAALVAPESQQDSAQLVRRMFRRVLAREPSDEEIGAALRFLAALSDVDDAGRGTALAQALLTSNEFLFVD